MSQNTITDVSLWMSVEVVDGNWSRIPPVACPLVQTTRLLTLTFTFQNVSREWPGRYKRIKLATPPALRRKL
jgi:hypothetical protein